MTKVRGWITKFDWRIYAAIAIMAAFLGLLVVSYSSYQSESIKEDIQQRAKARDKQFAQTSQRLDTSEQDVASLKTALAAQIAQFQKCKKEKEGAAGCNVPVAPTPAAIVQGPEGKQGPGPSIAQLLVVSRQAILEFCANDRCKGATGNTPSESQLISLIERVQLAYCAAHNNCQGPQGAQGNTGEKGEKGDTGGKGDTGAPGPTCPEGYTPEPTTLVTDDGPVDAIVCRASPPSEQENP